jgi:hypothetical protein
MKKIVEIVRSIPLPVGVTRLGMCSVLLLSSCHSLMGSQNRDGGGGAGGKVKDGGEKELVRERLERSQ